MLTLYLVFFTNFDFSDYGSKNGSEMIENPIQSFDKMIYNFHQTVSVFYVYHFVLIFCIFEAHDIKEVEYRIG